MSIRQYGEVSMGALGGELTKEIKGVRDRLSSSLIRHVVDIEPGAQGNADCAGTAGPSVYRPGHIGLWSMV
ncbi:MAG: hypothetical protein NTU97_03195, partial [Candidatus Magasanikbacteria bacterium]|nr:hypothetical protein [Candidatus Magasanikbacteria bacterium]